MTAQIAHEYLGPMPIPHPLPNAVHARLNVVAVELGHF